MDKPLSEGQRRVLELIQQGARLYSPWFLDNPAWLEYGREAVDHELCEELCAAGFLDIDDSLDPPPFTHGLSITPAGRAALHPDTDTDTDAGKQGVGGETGE